MLHVNEDMNDDLFRRAADNYPLRTDGADWETMRRKLEIPDEDDTPPPAVAKRKNYRFLLLLLLLIPIGIFEGKYGFLRKQFLGNKENNTVASVKNNSSEALNENKRPGVNSLSKENNTNISNTKAHTDNSPEPQNQDLITTAAATPSAKDNNSTSVTTGHATSNTTAKADDLYSPKKINRRTGGKTKVNIQASVASGDDNTNIIADNDAVSNKKITRKVNNGGKKNVQISPAVPATDENVDAAKEVTIPAVPNNKNIAQVQTETKEPVATAINPTTDKAATAVPEKEESKNAHSTGVTKEKEEPAKKKEDQKDRKENKKHFYAGIIGGPDFSSIKLQSVKKIGFNYGVIAGYKINKHFAVETGFLSDEKKYGTDPKYFNLKGYNLPPDSKVSDIDGRCRMYELPVNVTYSFGIKKKSSWFAAAGVSSYFMKNEYYAYDVTYYGITYPYSTNAANKSTSLFTMVNLSVGYTHKLGNICDLRIEPFAKLPVKKIGSGSLPIQSGGIFIGFTKMLF